MQTRAADAGRSLTASDTNFLTGPTEPRESNQALPDSNTLDSGLTELHSKWN